VRSALVILTFASGCDRVFLTAPDCLELLCADFDTRATGEDLFPTHYELDGTSTSVRGPAVSPPNSFNAEAEAGTVATYAVIQREVGKPGMHALIEFWAAAPQASVMCQPWAAYLRLDTNEPEDYQIQYRIGTDRVTTYVTTPSKTVMHETMVADTKEFHLVQLEVDVAKSIVIVAIDHGIPERIEGIDLSEAIVAQPEFQIGIGLAPMHTACSVLIDDVTIFAR